MTALQESKGEKRLAARLLGICEPRICYRIRKNGLEGIILGPASSQKFLLTSRYNNYTF
ncbi:MAG: hypothetical protein ACLFPG_07600 [Desulfohalobiaceae bacterium]